MVSEKVRVVVVFEMFGYRVVAKNK